MTIAIVHRNRPWLPTLNLLLAGGAAVLGVIAITSDDVGSATAEPPVVAGEPPDDLPAPKVESADYRAEVAAADACRQARANEPC